MQASRPRISFTLDPAPHWTAAAVAGMVGQHPKVDGRRTEVVAAELVGDGLRLTVDIDGPASMLADLNAARWRYGPHTYMFRPVPARGPLPDGITPSGDPLVDEIRRELAAFRIESGPAEPDTTGPATPAGRATYIGGPAFFRLNHAALIVARAFDATPYLVGSALQSRNYRDVDVRVLLDVAEYDRLFPAAGPAPHTHPLWSLLCAAISDWLGSTTGLPVDFQVQRQDEANDRYGGRRVALGIYPTPPGTP